MGAMSTGVGGRLGVGGKKGATDIVVTIVFLENNDLVGALVVPSAAGI